MATTGKIEEKPTFFTEKKPNRQVNGLMKTNNPICDAFFFHFEKKKSNNPLEYWKAWDCDY